QESIHRLQTRRATRDVGRGGWPRPMRAALSIKFAQPRSAGTLSRRGRKDCLAQFRQQRVIANERRLEPQLRRPLHCERWLANQFQLAWNVQPFPAFFACQAQTLIYNSTRAAQNQGNLLRIVAVKESKDENASAKRCFAPFAGERTNPAELILHPKTV